MSDKAKELAEAYVDGMDDIVDKLKELPISGKIGTKIGFALGWNPVTAPIVWGAVGGAMIAYGGSRIVKKIIKKG